nr:hypothetical protein [Tanacetum cinerariifolium]
MSPQRLRKKSVKKLVERRVAKAIEEYEKTRADSINAGGSGSASTGGSTDVQGCSYKTFINCKPHSFNGTKGVVGLKRWFEKMEQVFEICKCAKDDKVKFVMCMLEGRALTWWNRNVQTLGLANANQIPWSNLKAMMTNEYCPATEIQKIEQELWTLTLKGDDIEAYNNLEQAVQGRATRIGESNKRKWEDHQKTPTTITPTTTTTTTVTETTAITNNKTGGKKLPGPMLQPQLRVGVMRGTYQGATVATPTTMGNVLQSVESAKELVIRRKIVELGPYRI